MGSTAITESYIAIKQRRKRGSLGESESDIA